MRLAICDDEKEMRSYIAGVAREYFPQLTIEEYEKADDMITSNCDADILFLDIQMPGMNGMDAARLIRENGKRTVIIFVTVIEDYVFNAFDVGAAGYIVKPFKEDKLIESINRAIHLANDQLKLEESENNENKGKRSLTVKCDGVNRNVELESIIYAEVHDRKVIMHLCNDTSISYYGRMADLEGVLGKDFFRVHRAYIVNMRFVKAYDWKNVKAGGVDIPVARGKYQELVKAYMSYHTRMEGM